MLLAYFGPEPALPVISTVATVVGIVLVTGRMTLPYLARRYRGRNGKGRD